MIKTLIFLCFLLCFNALQAQYCTDDIRFTDAEYFKNQNLDFIKDVKYGEAINIDGQKVDLLLDMYSPSKVDDDLVLRPAIVIIHGGAFVFGDKSEWRQECIEFAKRGFVAISIKYRLGLSTTVEGIKEAVYRANQDANAAMRFIVHYASDYGIDSNYLFIGGGSAGAITALNVAYLSQSDWDKILPHVKNKLGGLNESGNKFKEDFSIKGIFNNWGATYSEAISESEIIPMISFHGSLDDIVAMDSTNLGMHGSAILHELLSDKGVCSDFTLKTDAGHVFYRDYYGTKFRVSRAACFFKSIFCDDCTEFFSKDSIAANCSEDYISVVETDDAKKFNIDSKIHPNPASYFVEIQSKDSQLVSIYNYFGEIVLSYQSAKNEKRKVDLSDFAQGMYFVKIGNKVQRLLIQR